MFIKIGLFSLICIIAIFFALRKSYAIPSSDCLHQLIKNTSISEIYIYSKFSKIRQIRISNTKDISEIKTQPKSVPEEQLPEVIIPTVPVIVPIKSPWIGTLHLTNSKTEKPYIEVGQMINTGDIVCHITSLLLETDIKSEICGMVIEILREDKSAIDFGKAIILVEVI
ncbi:MAG: biotin/lipoyl-containing protein [bacterium]|nr:biotin/lipoyl-containing protein [bacterium]